MLTLSSFPIEVRFHHMDAAPVPLSDSVDSSLSSNQSFEAESFFLEYAPLKKMVEEEGNLDVFLLDAMTCSICFMIYDEPKQLECGHSFCSTCIDRLCNEMEEKYTCPLCRAHFTSPPVINYSLKGLKKKRVRCGLCVINGHAKMGHAVSRYGESKERVKIAQHTFKEMVNEITQFFKEFREMISGRMICVDNFFELLDKQRTQFKTLEASLSANAFISKKDIEMRLEHAQRLHEIYMRTGYQFAGFINNMFNEITVLTERTAVELEGHAVYGDILNKKELIAQSSEEQTRSWFEYQRKGRINSLCSAIARRNAAIARRHLMTCGPQSESEIVVDALAPTLSAEPNTSILPISTNGGLLAGQT
uniref:RING-type E3 ubiquitin transferase n=1 Tax=Elaeophora elaphi TaxID=1147741 RepID=A0A0R3RT80_9BILA